MLRYSQAIDLSSPELLNCQMQRFSQKWMMPSYSNSPLFPIDPSVVFQPSYSLIMICFKNSWNRDHITSAKPLEMGEVMVPMYSRRLRPPCSIDSQSILTHSNKSTQNARNLIPIYSNRSLISHPLLRASIVVIFYKKGSYCCFNKVFDIVACGCICAYKDLDNQQQIHGLRFVEDAQSLHK